MKRRDFVAALLTIPITRASVAFAQSSSSKVWHVGYLYPGNLDNPSDRSGFDLFRSELGRLGFPEGEHLVIDAKFAKGKPDTLDALAKAMADARPDVIVAIATPAIAAAQKASSTIPIVMMPATDPIGSGFVRSLARPGGNITGMANMYGDSVGKSVELLHSLLPAAKRVAILMSSNPTHPQQLEIASTAAKALGLVTIPVMAPNQNDLEQAFEKMRAEKCDALFVLADPLRPPIVQLAAKAKIPAVYQYGGFVDLGGLASYGAEFNAILRKGAEYVVRIFKGANPAETPVEQPVVFELAINLKTARELGVNIPEAILARADRIIE
jgi:putative ABC transport system substrate-binding protein